MIRENLPASSPAEILTPGATLRLRSLQHHYYDGFTKGTLGYAAPNQQVYVVMLLGLEPMLPNGRELDVDAALAALGYRLVPIEEATPNHTTTG